MKPDDLIHLPELFSTYGKLKKHLRILYNLNIKQVKMEQGLTDQQEQAIMDIIYPSFFNLELINTKFPDYEDYDVEFLTGDNNVNQVLISIIPGEKSVFDDISANPNIYKEGADIWAQKNKLRIADVYTADQNHEVIFLFDIISENPQPEEISETITSIKDRISKIEKHSKENQINNNAYVALQTVLLDLMNIESNIDESIPKTNQKASQGAFIPNKGEKYWAVLKDRHGKVLERMEVSFKDESYARDAFKVSKITVRPTDLIEFE